jgi:hypothetical protein
MKKILIVTLLFVGCAGNSEPSEKLIDSLMHDRIWKVDSINAETGFKNIDFGNSPGMNIVDGHLVVDGKLKLFRPGSNLDSLRRLYPGVSFDTLYVGLIICAFNKSTTK